MIYFLDQQKQGVTCIEEKLNQTGTSCIKLEERMESKLSTQLHGSLDDTYLCHTTTQQIGDKGIIVEDLQKSLREDKPKRARDQVITNRHGSKEIFQNELFMITTSLTHHNDLKKGRRKVSTSQHFYSFFISLVCLFKH